MQYIEFTEDHQLITPKIRYDFVAGDSRTEDRLPC